MCTGGKLLQELRAAGIRGGRKFWHVFQTRAEVNLVEANWNKKGGCGLPVERGNAKPGWDLALCQQATEGHLTG